VRLGHLAVVLQRGDGAVRDRVDRPLAQRCAGDGLEHLDEDRRLLRYAHLVLEVLAPVRERRPGDLEVTGARVHVTRRDRRPDEVDLGQRIIQRDHAPQVVARPLVALAGQVVEHVRRGAVARAEHLAGADDAVIRRVATGEPDLAGHLLEAALDELPRQLGGQLPGVDLGAGLSKEVGEGRRVVCDADLREHPHHLLVEELLVGLGQVLQAHTRHVASSFGRPPPVGAAAPFLVILTPGP